jgi:hypothetical protein
MEPSEKTKVGRCCTSLNLTISLGTSEYSHAVELTDAVRGLADLEREVQLNYLQFITSTI